MVRVLKDAEQIAAARRRLRDLGCDLSRGWRGRMFQLRYVLRYPPRIPRLELRKSWDVLTMLEHIKACKPDRQAVIYDVGSMNSEIPLALWASGYRNIYAADLNPLGRTITWYGNGIRFRREDFYETTLPGGSVDVITALSSLEHGYQQERFLQTAHRILRPNGLVVLTTDFRSEKLSVPEFLRPYGLSYLVFSRTEILNLIEAAGRFGFLPSGDVVWGDSEDPIACYGLRYTFVFLSLRKGDAGQTTTHASPGSPGREVIGIAGDPTR